MQRREFLQMAAVTAGVAAGDVSEIEIGSQQDRLLELADRDDDERWDYETVCNLAHVRYRMLDAELDTICEEPSGTLSTYTVDSSGIPLTFEISTDNGESVGAMVHLSAEQAEGLAVDLLEQAHAAREENDG